MKPNRLEDLGRIDVHLDNLLVYIEDTWGRYAHSKHTEESFLLRYVNTNSLEELHDQLRFIKEKLYEISEIAKGNNYHE